MLATLPFLLAIPLVQAFSIQAPNNWISPGNNTVGWTTSQGDASLFNVFVIAENASILNGAYGVAQTVESSLGSKAFVLPPVPLSVSYTIAFVNVTNSTDVYASSGLFNIAPNATALSSLSQPFSQSTATGGNSLAAAATGSLTASPSSSASAASTGGTRASSAGRVFDNNHALGGLLVGAMGLAVLL